MKISPKDLEMFHSLKTSGTGIQLVDYLDRLQSFVCDARNWGEKDTKESTQMVADIIQKHLVDKIKLQNETKEAEVNEFE